MTFADEFRDFQQWKQGVSDSPEAYDQYKKVQAVYDTYELDKVKYEIGLDLVELVNGLLAGTWTYEEIGQAVVESYDWESLAYTEPE